MFLSIAETLFPALRFRQLCSIVIVLAATAGFCASTGRAQSISEAPNYTRKNTIGILGAYSPDSSHIILGDAERRKLLNIGVSYSRRLVAGHQWSLQYDLEILPVALESDPLTRVVSKQFAPIPATSVEDLPFASLVTCAPEIANFAFTQNGVTYSEMDTVTCHGRQWTIGEGISPAGMQWNFLTTRRIQPIIEGHGGYMYSTQPIPIVDAGSFNFTFDIGAGFEVFRSRMRSIRAEYRFHHLSNHNTATFNPGVDNGLIQVSYCFGR